MDIKIKLAILELIHNWAWPVTILIIAFMFKKEIKDQINKDKDN